MSQIASFPWHQETSYKINSGMKWGNSLRQFSLLPLSLSTCVDIVPLMGQFKLKETSGRRWKDRQCVSVMVKEFICPDFLPWGKMKKKKPQRNFYPLRHRFMRSFLQKEKSIKRKLEETSRSPRSILLHHNYKSCLLQSIPRTPPSQTMKCSYKYL